MNIYGLQGDNLGGIAQIFFTLQENLNQISFSNDVLLQETVSLNKGIWFEFIPTARTTRFTEKEKFGAHGYIYEQQLAGFRAKDSEALAAAYLALRGKKLIALYQDNNGVWRLIGDNEDYLKLTHDLDTGAAPVERNGTSFTFVGESTHPAYYYTGEVPASADQPAETGGNSGFVTITDAAGNILETIPAGGTYRITSGFRLKGFKTN